MLRHREHERRKFVCDPCRFARRDYNPRCDPTFRKQLLILFRDSKGRVVYPMYELGIAFRFRQQVKDEVNALRRSLAVATGEQIVGFRETGGYQLKVSPLPES